MMFLSPSGLMRSIPTAIPDVCELRLPRFADSRGWFAEMFKASDFAAAGLPSNFVQDNQSLSRRGVLRGLHYQVGQPQGKLVRVVSGRIFDVAVDLRRASPTFGRHVGLEIAAPDPDSPDDVQALWIPEGFAHGFYVLSDAAEVFYKTTAPYHPPGDRTLLWNAPELGIAWPITAGGQPVLSAKDASGTPWAEAEKF